MTYIILAAGKGSTLKPLTLKYPKTSYKLDEDTTVLQRMVRKIRQYDTQAEIVVVVGYLADTIKAELVDDNVRFIFNPFYEVSNSISSMWFARSYLERENVAIIHGDAVFDDDIISKYVVQNTNSPYIALDSSRIIPGEHNVLTKDGKVLVMSKKIENATGKSACLIKLDAVTSRLLKEEIDLMLQNNMYDQYFEDALVQMVMFHNLELGCVDFCHNRWSEINTVDDLLKAQEIHNSEKELK